MLDMTNGDSVKGVEFHQSHKDAAKKASASLPQKVIVHPLVLLSITDHFERISKGTEKRVCGVLLGKNTPEGVDISSSYAVPFEEDPKNPKVWFFDHNYHEAMYALLRKVNANEKVIGWYSSGPLIRSNDLELHEILRTYCDQPVFLIADISGSAQSLNADSTLGRSHSLIKTFCSLPSIPEITKTDAPIEDEEDEDEDTMIDTTIDTSSTKPKTGSIASSSTHSTRSAASTNSFVSIPSEVGAEEAEEIGVEHLLREDTSGTSTGTLRDAVLAQAGALRSLAERLRDIESYLVRVASGTLPPNAKILSAAQDILSLCPDVLNPGFVAAIGEKVNDSLVAVYLASLVRSVTSLHSLLENRLANRLAERSASERAALIEALKQTVTDEAGGEEHNFDDMDLDAMNF